MVMAQIYAIVGEYDLAIDELEYHLSIPGWSTPNFLKADPLFDSLHDHPRFQALVEKYEKKYGTMSQL
jgi:hypothetical protein